MDNSFRDYVEFIDAVLLFRTSRDTIHSCSPGYEPELWFEKRMDGLAASQREDPDYYDSETVQWLSLATKIAELIDDRKAWLLDEIDNDIYQIHFPGGQHVTVEVPDLGKDSEWWFSHDIMDDYDCRINMGTGDGVVYLYGNIKADDKETASRILRERVEDFLNLPMVA